MNDDNKNKLEAPTSSWTMIHYIIGSLCLLMSLIVWVRDDQGFEKSDEAPYIFSIAIGCFIFGTILQSLKTICFYLRKIYERMD